jgi:hypothetical protein
MEAARKRQQRRQGSVARASLHFKRGTPVRKTKKLRAIIDPAAFGDGRIHHAAGQIGMTVEGFLSACCTLWLRASLTCPDGRLAGILAAQGILTGL